MTNLTIIIMAAGKGTLLVMKSSKPKVLQPLAGKPSLCYITYSPLPNNWVAKNIIIYGFEGQQVKDAFADEQIDWVEQVEQLGTGHAVQMTLPVLPTDGKKLILSGDVPLIGVDTLEISKYRQLFCHADPKLSQPIWLGSYCAWQQK